jgi:hypothetical protein
MNEEILVQYYLSYLNKPSDLEESVKSYESL